MRIKQRKKRKETEDNKIIRLSWFSFLVGFQKLPEAVPFPALTQQDVSIGWRATDSRSMTVVESQTMSLLAYSIPYLPL